MYDLHKLSIRALSVLNEVRYVFSPKVVGCQQDLGLPKNGLPHLRGKEIKNPVGLPLFAPAIKLLQDQGLKTL